MTVFHYIPLVGALFNFALSIFVLASDRRSRINQVFFVWSLGIAIWNLGTYAMFRVGNAAEAFEWAKFLQYGVIALPPTLLHLSFLITGRPVGTWIHWLYGLHIGLGVMNACGWFISGVKDFGFAYYSIAGPGFWIYAVSLVQTFISVGILWKSRKELPPRRRNRFNGILAAQSLIVVFGTNDILPILGFSHYPFLEAKILPYGSLAAAAYGIMVAYSVFQHKLLDVHLALGRSAAHVVRFIFLIGIALVLQLSVVTFAPEDLATKHPIAVNILVLMLATLIASVLFPKLLGGAAEELERRLLGDHFEYQDQIRATTEQIRWRTDLPALLNDLHDLFVNIVRVGSYWIILRDETNHASTVKQSYPDHRERQLELTSDSEVFRFFQDSSARFLALQTPRQSSREGSPESKIRKELEDFPGEFVFPLIIGSEPLGLIILGEKAQRDPYTQTDIRLLANLAENVAPVVNQISLKNQLLLNQELDLLGRMSRGMAHDLNNLTTPVWTLLQLLGEGVPADVLRTELGPIAIRNIQAMRAYIREALFFSENLRPDIHDARLDELVQSVVEHARQSRRKGKNIRYTVDTPGEVVIEMDLVLIERLLVNLISNAVDASPDNSEVHVELIRLVKTEATRDWYRIRVSDQGSGIASDDLERIFQPYFTTKKTGDENRGFGLGLAICRKIANLHNGSLGVQSVLGRGTTVNLDLPSLQKPGIRIPPGQTSAWQSPQPVNS